MNNATEFQSKDAATPMPAQAHTAGCIVAMIAWPVVIGGLAVFASAPFVQVVALPLLLLSWIGCMRLALTTSGEPPSRLMQLGTGVLIAVGLLSLVFICVRVAGTVGFQRGTGDPDGRIGLILYHVGALGAAGLVAWGQKLRSTPTKRVGWRWLIYWFAYCPMSVLMAKVLTRWCIALGA